MILVFLFLTSITLCNRLLGSSTSLELTQVRSFVWLSNIPLYICTTSSLFIHSLIDIHVLAIVNSYNEHWGMCVFLDFFFFLIPIYRVKSTSGMQKLKDGFSGLFFMATSSPKFLEAMSPAEVGGSCC